MNLVQALYLNNDVEPLNNEKVRQALSYAIDPDEIMMMIADGRGARVGSSMYPGLTKYFHEDLVNYYTKDTEKAKELLKEAGYEDGFDLEISVCSTQQQHVATAQVIVEELKAIGVNATINSIEWNAWLEDVYNNREYEATVVGFDASALTGRAMLERFTSESSKNISNFRSEEYDEAFAKAVVAINEEEKVSYYKECQEILTEQAINVYIQDLASLVAIRDGYAGYEFYPLYVQDMSRIYAVE